MPRSPTTLSPNDRVYLVIGRKGLLRLSSLNSCIVYSTSVDAILANSQHIIRKKEIRRRRLKAYVGCEPHQNKRGQCSVGKSERWTLTRYVPDS